MLINLDSEHSIGSAITDGKKPKVKQTTNLLAARRLS